jgi:hypothetical protein
MNILSEEHEHMHSSYANLKQIIFNSTNQIYNLSSTLQRVGKSFSV